MYGMLLAVCGAAVEPAELIGTRLDDKRLWHGSDVLEMGFGEAVK